MNGTVKWFNRKKGFGFIQGEDGEDYFVHYSQLPKGVFLRDAEEVTFEPAETEKGRQAKNVVTKGGEAAPAEGEAAPAEKPAKKEGKKKKGESEEAPAEESEDFGEEEFEEESEEASEETEDETY